MLSPEDCYVRTPTLPDEECCSKHEWPVSRSRTAASRFGRPTATGRDRRERAGVGDGTAAEPAPIADSETVGAAPIVDAIEGASQPAAAPSAPQRRRGAEIEAKVRLGELPRPPDFSAPNDARFRAKLAALVELKQKADDFGLRAVPINPVSSRSKALARYRDLAVLPTEAREGPT